jgi:hypothetical protein
MLTPEADLQIQVADLLRIQEAPRGFLFFSCPNEGMGKARTGAALGRMARLKRMGLRPGVADLVIVKNGLVYFLELKSNKGQISDSQAVFGLNCRRVGARYNVAYSFEQAQKILQDWGIIA